MIDEYTQDDYEKMLQRRRWPSAFGAIVPCCVGHISIPGGGLTISQGPVATLTSTPSPAAGDIFLATDAPYDFRYNGSGWDAFLHTIGKVNPPKQNGQVWTWANQGTASVIEQTNGGVLLSIPANTQFHVRYVAAPTAPYTVTAVVSALQPFLTSGSNSGICFFKHTTGEFTMQYLSNSQSFGQGAQSFTDLTGTTRTQDLFDISSQWYAFNLVVMRIQYDGTHASFYVSTDEYNFVTLSSGITLPFTPTDIGFWIGGPDQGSLNVLSWTVTQP